MKIIEREALFIKKEDLKERTLKVFEKDFTLRFYDEKACNRCEFLEERHSDLCNNCAAFKAEEYLLRHKVIKGRKYLGLPIGAKKKIEKRLAKYNHTYKPKYRKIRRAKDIKPFKFLGELYPEQKAAVKDTLKGKRGVLRAPPRSGKTVMGVYLTSRVRKKTLIIASQKDWLDGFYETFCGSATQKPLTNLKGAGIQFKDTKKGYGKARVAFCRTLEDFQNYDICLSTVQSLYSASGRKILPKLRSMFGLVIVDEIHKGAAQQYSKVLYNLNAEYYIGLTGTDSRKDMRFSIIRNILGENLHEMEKAQLRPRIHLVNSKYKNDGKNRPWVYAVNNLENSMPKLRQIAEYAAQDVKNGHMVLIPLARVKVIGKLVEMINKKIGKEVCFEFSGRVKAERRKELVDMARGYEAKVLVGQSSVIFTGVNIPRASMLYEVTPSSNLENCQQRTARILTPYDDKPTPAIRYWLDDSSLRKNCMRNEYWNCVHKLFNPIISDKDLRTLKQYFQTRRQRDFSV